MQNDTATLCPGSLIGDILVGVGRWVGGWAGRASVITLLRERAQSCALRAISLTPTGSVDDLHSVARYPVMRRVRVTDGLSSR